MIMAAALLFSCKKDISEIGVNVVGENPLEVIYVDTFSVRAYSEIIDSMSTGRLSSHLFGAYTDPVFGTMNASIYSQFRLEAGNEEYQFQENAVYDSIILYLAYAKNEVYGDENYQQHISIYEIGDQLQYDSTYYHFQNMRTKDELLGEMLFVPDFDSVDYYDISDGDTLESGKKIIPLAIPLTDDLGLRLMEYDSSIYEDNATFMNEFAGLHMTTLDQHLPAGMGGLVNMNFLSDDTKIVLYYHYDDVIDDVDTTINVEFNLVCNSNTARFGNYNHYGYHDASPEFKAQVLDLDTSNLEDYGQEQVYLQSLAGVRTIIEFPYLSEMDDYYNYAVNEAKLYLHNVDEESSTLDPISSLTITYDVTVDSVDYEYTIPDAASGSNYFNGNYNSTDKNYYFRITQYLQDLIQGHNKTNQIKIQIIGGAVNANRSIIGGWNPMDETKKLHLQVVYTKIDSDE